MYETVKIVNGYEIKRMVGTHGVYHIDTRVGVTSDGRTYKTQQWFRTIKAAAEWAAAN